VKIRRTIQKFLQLAVDPLFRSFGALNESLPMLILSLPSDIVLLKARLEKFRVDEECHSVKEKASVSSAKELRRATQTGPAHSLVEIPTI
jgi:hypothetical protein